NHPHANKSAKPFKESFHGLRYVAAGKAQLKYAEDENGASIAMGAVIPANKPPFKGPKKNKFGKKETPLLERAGEHDSNQPDTERNERNNCDSIGHTTDKQNKQTRYSTEHQSPLHPQGAQLQDSEGAANGLLHAAVSHTSARDEAGMTPTKWTALQPFRLHYVH
ncbi:hypothetical protein B484DRAFT_405222, partial [Ochromonadaceae sp. CCMP2298]